MSCKVLQCNNLLISYTEMQGNRIQHIKRNKLCGLFASRLLWNLDPIHILNYPIQFY